MLVRVDRYLCSEVPKLLDRDLLLWRRFLPWTFELDVQVHSSGEDTETVGVRTIVHEAELDALRFWVLFRVEFFKCLLNGFLQSLAFDGHRSYPESLKGF